MASFFPNGLLFKEWRQQRIWMGLLLLFTGFEPVIGLTIQLMQWWAQPTFDHWYSLQRFAAGLIGTVGSNPRASTLVLGIFGAAIVGAEGLSSERAQGGLWFTLSGPYTRRQVLQTKIIVGWTGVTAVLLFNVLWILLMDGLGHLHISMGIAWHWFCWYWLLETAMFVCGVLAATLVGNTIAAPVFGAGIAAIPIFLGAYLEIICEMTNQYPSTPLTYLSGLSPLSPLYYLFNGIQNGWSVVVMFFWIVGGTFLAMKLFSCSAVERSGNFYLFPYIWQWSVWAGCLLAGLLMEAFFFREGPTSAAAFWFTYIPVAVVLYLVFYLLLRMYRKRFLEV